MDYAEMSGVFFIEMCAAFDLQYSINSVLFDAMYCMGGEL